VRAAATPAVSFTSGSTTRFTFGFANLTKGVTYNIQILVGKTKTPLPVDSTSGGTGGTLSGTGTANLFLVVPAGSGLATVTGLTIVKALSEDQSVVLINYKLTTATKYKTLTTKWCYDHKYGDGWRGSPLKDTIVTGNQSVSNNLIVSNKLTATTTTTNIITANTDVVLNGVSLFTALSSYLLPPAPKKYLPYGYTTMTGLQNTYVALTTNPTTGVLYGITTDGRIYSIIDAYHTTPNTPYTFNSATETKILDLTDGSVGNWVNETPLIYEGSGIVDFCFDNNQLTTEQGDGFYIMDAFSVIWVALQSGDPIGSYLFPDESTPSGMIMAAIEPNADSTQLYFTLVSNTGRGVFIYSADPYSVLNPGENDGYAIPPTLLYSDVAGKYSDFVAADLAFNKTNGLIYCTLSNEDPAQSTNGYVLSLTTNGVVVQAATNSIVNSIDQSYAIAVDSTGAIAVIGTSNSSEVYAGDAVMYVVPANFIAIPSAYTQPFGAGIVPRGEVYALYSVAGGSNGKLYVLDFYRNNIYQLIPA
jgi:hypothetical protein